MNRFGLMCAFLAGSAVCGGAFAQQEPEDREITLNEIVGGDYERGGFGERLDIVVYSIGSTSETAGTNSNSPAGSAVYDDVTFGGPGLSGDITINGMAFGVWRPTVGVAQLYMRVTFFDTHDNDATTETPYSGSSIVWDLDIGNGWATSSGGGRSFPNPVTFVTGVTLPDAFIGVDRMVGVKLEVYLDDAFTTRAVGYTAYRRLNHTSHVVGSSNEVVWYAPTVPGDGVIPGSSRAGTVAAPRGAFLKFQGTGYTPPPPTVDYDLACLADGASSFAVDTTVSQGVEPNVAWAQVCLSGDALDNAGITGAGQFLDMWISGSSDLSLGLFDPISGALIAQDAGDGPDGNGQFSFGVGRRPPVVGTTTNGTQRDGRDYRLGSLGLANGTYLMAIAPAGSTFSSGWIVNPGAGGGAATLHTETNINGAPLAASILPPIDQHLGDNLVAPGAPLPSGTRTPYQVSWYSFSTCSASTDATPVTIDMLGSALGAAGSSHALFNTSGDMLASSTMTPGNAPDLVFDGTNVLPAGTYYLAQTWQDAQFAASGRWHVRTTSGSNGFTWTGTVNVFASECDVPGCPWQATGCTADQDGDDDVDSDDIVLFFSNFENGETCGDQDGDEDVDSDDIVIFFGLFEQGGC